MKFAKWVVFYIGVAAGMFAAAQTTKPVPTICADGSKNCIEALKMENLDLKIGKIVDEFNTQAQKQFEVMVKPQMQPLQDERTQLVQKLNAAHPGYQWHDSTGPGDVAGFRPVAAPQSPASAPAKPIDKSAAKH